MQILIKSPQTFGLSLKFEVKITNLLFVSWCNNTRLKGES